MADDFELEAEIGIDVSGAVRDARRLADALADLNDATGNTDSNIERLERSSAGAASTLSRFVADSRNASRSARDQAKAINAVVNQYRQLSQVYGKGIAGSIVSGQNPAQTALRATQKQMDDERAFSALLAQENNKREAEAAQSATEVARERERIAKQSRARELSALRENIERREQMEAQAARSIAQEQQKIAEQGRQRELADLRRAMTERYTLYDEAQAENRRRSVANAIQSTQGLTFGQALNSNAFDGLRESQEYADALNESMRGLANQRYALYDVATSLGAVATAAIAAGSAAAVMGGQYDKAFGQVERTTLLAGDQAAALREELIGITTDLPTSFADVTNIATLGAQMNIADEALAGFTETVTQFSSATDVSVDAAATGFGRLAQLTKTPQTEISNLASSIYQTGINAVATESEILSVASQIATAGDLAGFTNTEIIALASSLSSLGVAPEQSRGAIMRIFGDITSAAGEGGEAVAQFAQTAGMSADAFGEMWGSDPQQAFSAYLDGLSQLDSQLLDVTLRQQGFVNVRDRNVLSRLANNTEVYNQALQDTSEAYTQNTALADGVAIAQDNLIDRLTRLANSFKALVASIGSNEALNLLAEGLISATEAVRRFVETPVGQAISGTVLVLTTLVGVIGAAAAAYAIGRASLLAFVIALRSNVESSNGLTLSLRALTAELLRLTPAGARATATMTALSTAEGRAAAGARVLGTAMRGALLTTGIGAAMVALPALINAVGDAFQSSAEHAEEYFAAVEGGEGLEQALRADTQAWQANGEAIETVKNSVAVTEESLNNLGTTIQNATGAEVSLNEATTATTESMRDQTVAIGEQTAAWLAQTLANDKNIQELYQHKDALDALGFSMREFIQATLENPGTGGQDYLRGVVQEFMDSGEGFQNALAQSDVSAQQLTDTISSLTSISEAYDAKLDGQIASLEIQRDVMAAAGVEIDNTGLLMDEAAGSAEELDGSLSDLVDSSFDSASSLADVQEALYGLGQSLYENGNSFSAYSEAGRANLEALQQTVSAMAASAGDDSVALGNNIIGLMSYLQNMGVDTTNELNFLGATLNQLVGPSYGLDFNSAAARADIEAFIERAIFALRTRAALERTSFNFSAQQQEASGDPFGAALTRVQGAATAAQYEVQARQLESLKGSLTEFGDVGGTAGRSIGDGFRAANREATDAGNAAQKAGKKAGSGAREAADGAKEAQKEFRTLKDYADDLSSVFDRQLEFAFGNQNAQDDTADQLQSMRDRLKDAREAISQARSNIKDLATDLRDARQAVKDFNAELKGLRADRRILQYQLSVAVEYGDSLRATEIRAELAEKNEEISKTENDRADAVKDVNKILKDQDKAQKELSKAQKDASASLKGNSEAARENRRAVQDLLQSYADQLVQLAANGASQDTLKKKARNLRGEFEKQLRQMGYNREEVKDYSDEFKDFTEVIKKVPRNVTVKTKAGTSAAQKAINEFIRKNKNRSVSLKAKVSAPKSVSGGTYRPNKISGSSGAKGGTYRPNSVNSRGPLYTPSVRANNLYIANQIKKLGGILSGIFGNTGGRAEYLATGGVSGLHPGAPKGKDTIPAWLAPGEWVIQKQAVDYYGNDFFAALNSMRYPQYLAQGTSSASAVSAGSPSVQLVELMPNQVQQIVRAVSTEIRVDGQVLAGTVNNSNRNNSVRGGN